MLVGCSCPEAGRIKYHHRSVCGTTTTPLAGSLTIGAALFLSLLSLVACLLPSPKHAPHQCPAMHASTAPSPHSLIQVPLQRILHSLLCKLFKNTALPWQSLFKLEQISSKNQQSETLKEDFMHFVNGLLDTRKQVIISCRSTHNRAFPQ